MLVVQVLGVVVLVVEAWPWSGPTVVLSHEYSLTLSYSIND